MMILSKRLVPLITLLMLPFTTTNGQDSNLKTAESLQKSYRFEEAKALYHKILVSTHDTLALLKSEERMTQCDNGINMMQYTVSPTTVAIKNVSVKDFYLYFSDLEDNSYLRIPNPFVQDTTHRFVTATYFPESSTKLLFSAPDNSGSWNIYETDFVGGNTWSEPRILSEGLTSSGDEIFPILSSDGKELYFASDGHFGMGGFDLYVSRWNDDTEEWGLPENMGFPYSSTGDDLIYFNTLDGNYSMLASNRDCADDSVGIYVMDFIGTPVKKPLIDIREIQELAHLYPKSGNPVPAKDIQVTANDSNSKSELDNYSIMVSDMRSLRLELNKKLDKLREQRELYDKTENEGDKEFLAEMIQEWEEDANILRKSLDEVTVKVQNAEMEFLTHGIIPTISEEKVPESQNFPSKPKYQFSKHHFGEIPHVTMQQPKPQFDYSFKILKEARMAEDNTRPDGIIYQIQIAVLSKKGTLKSFKGLSPIFENHLKSGKYLYNVGLFAKHSEALSCLNQVRKAGFPKAFIVAFNNGKSISVKEARLNEDKQPNVASYQVLLSGYQSEIPAPVLSAIKESCDKDIAKSTAEGKTVFIIGPFTQKGEAEYLAKILIGIGVEDVSLETIKQ